MLLLLALLALQEECPPTQEEAIRAWIEELGADDIDRRSEASRRLQAVGESVVPYLTEALASPDAEVRARCSTLISGFEWEPGARDLAGVGVEVPELKIPPERKREYEALAKAGKIDEIVKQDAYWLTCAFDGILSDRKVVAAASLRVIHGIIQKRAIPNVASDLASEPNLAAYRPAELRVEEYIYWAQWWFTVSARNMVAGWEEEPPR
jgi:hypothetical protein